MDGCFFFVFFLETKKIVKQRKVEVDVCWKKGVASDLYIAYVSIIMFLVANIYEVVVSDSAKMLAGFTPAKAGELPCWVDTAWVKTASGPEVRPMSLHGFTAVFALLGDGSLCVMERCTNDFLPVKV